MSLFIPAANVLFNSRRYRPGTHASQPADDGPGYPRQESWATDESAWWTIRIDHDGRPFWWNQITGQWTYQIKKPSRPSSFVPSPNYPPGALPVSYAWPPAPHTPAAAMPMQIAAAASAASAWPPMMPPHPLPQAQPLPQPQPHGY